MKSDPVAEREAFEVAMRTTFILPDAFEYDMHGSGYDHGMVDMAWLGWQARAALDRAHERDSRDAERYRALRDRFLAADFAWGDPETSVLVFEMRGIVSVSPDLDATIDAALIDRQETR